MINKCKSSAGGRFDRVFDSVLHRSGLVQVEMVQHKR